MTAAAAIAAGQGDEKGMRIAASVSAGLHVAFLLFAVLGLPQFLRTLPPVDDQRLVVGRQGPQARRQAQDGEEKEGDMQPRRDGRGDAHALLVAL
ncbi:MAG: hypothetical protein ACKOGH_04160, partial [Alphaproteobacteria bacterium]